MTGPSVRDAPTFLIVLPAISPTLAHTCVESMSPILRQQTFLIDNTGLGRIAHTHQTQVRWTLTPARNLGVASSWNAGVNAAQTVGANYLVIVSQSIRFGGQGGLDFLAALTLRQDRPLLLMDAQFGWKLIALATWTLDVVGGFDPIFDPAYFEESDVMYRMHLAGLASPWYNDRPGREQVVVDATSAGDAVAYKEGLVQLDYGMQAARYELKWGGQPRDERWTTPYGDPTLDFRFVGAREGQQA